MCLVIFLSEEDARNWDARGDWNVCGSPNTQGQDEYGVPRFGSFDLDCCVIAGEAVLAHTALPTYCPINFCVQMPPYSRCLAMCKG